MTYPTFGGITMEKRIISILVITFAILFGLQTNHLVSGQPMMSDTLAFNEEDPGEILLSYFDLQNRNTFVQVTNPDSVNPTSIHVQIFADSFNCVDRDFNDSLTPNETHVYDIRNLVSANGNPINFQIPDGSHGFVVISQNINDSGEGIIGNFRIVDNRGFEYKVNSAISEGNVFPGFVSSDFVVNSFTDQWGATHADIVAVKVIEQAVLPDGIRDLSVETVSAELSMFDDEETALSCGSVTFGCTEGDPDTVQFINQGINDVFLNSRGGEVICSGDFNTRGFLRANFQDDFASFAFAGLNNNSTRGSMDATLSSEITICSMAGSGNSINGLYDLILSFVVIGAVILFRRRTY